MPKIKEYPEASLADSNDALILDTEEGTKYIRASNLLASSGSTVDRTTASRSVVHFEDGADNIPMKDVLVHIEPVQAGSGDPSPTNVRPITGWTGAKVTRTGKNLFPQKTISLGKPGNRTAIVIFDQPIKPGTYIVSYKKSGTYIDNGFGIDCFNGNKNVGYVNINTGVFTISEEGTRLYFYYPMSSYDNNETLIFDEIQLELGSTATDYEPYHADTYDITFPTEAGTVYGGTLDVTKGELVVDRAIWTGNTADMNNSEGYPGWQSARIRDIVGGGLNGGVADAITNVSPAFAKELFRCAVGLNTVSSPNLGVLWLNKDCFNKNQTEWKALALDVQVVLPLATPITYTLTPQEITSLLGANNVWADTGDSEVEYRADTKLYIDRKVAELQALILENEGN